MHDTEGRLERCFSSVFPSLSPQEIRTASVKSVPVWDSLAAVTLITVLQEEFGIEIDLADFPLLTSFEAARNYVETHNGRLEFH